MEPVLNVTLNNGVEMPQLGFGVFKVPDDQATDAVLSALEVGYRSIDTAALYRNEPGVGKAIAQSGIARGELFVTSKVWNSDQGYDSTLAAYDASLARLGADYLDLYLIHWPTPAQDLYRDTWRALEKLLADGRVRAIGVSNFHPEHIQRLLDEYDVVPAVNQIELHPELQQVQLREFDAAHGIVTEAWSPLARATVLTDPVLTAIAERLGVTSAQVVLRWHLQLGNIVIPKSVTPARIAENFDVFGFELSEADLKRIATLDGGRRTGPDPDQL
ncbi:MAG TPA: aldo/keto reductase [Jatrophihabitantaceae bacterium]|nr:aldo/keto reductase [Jatrophihabitantaceae bacterium]